MAVYLRLFCLYEEQKNMLLRRQFTITRFVSQISDVFMTQQIQLSMTPVRNPLLMYYVLVYVPCRDGGHIVDFERGCVPCLTSRSLFENATPISVLARIAKDGTAPESP